MQNFCKYFDDYIIRKNLTKLKREVKNGKCNCEK